MKTILPSLTLIVAIAVLACSATAVAGESDRRYSRSPVPFNGKTGVTHVESRNSPTIGLFSRSSGVAASAGERGPAKERRYSYSPLSLRGKTGLTVTHGR